ncbi:MAG TPA: serine/threonine-protein kinase [Kofleriaceae bacterium]|nr:serine/threonine-protein kinase [Kofleriaceae bacterium]
MGRADDGDSAELAATVYDGGPQAVPRELTPGATFGRYLIGEPLGGGTMGVVLAATDPALDRKVALKLVRPGPASDGGAARQRLLREAQAMARLAHPNVVTVYEVGTVGDHVFVAMEHIAGCNLAEWLKQSRRSRREVVEAFAAAGRGLAAAHAAGIVHRDFKPANVLVSADGRIRVADFGLATSPVATAEQAAANPRAAPPIAITATGALLGTPAYMSPEQHEARTADARADQFSFCAALYEALHGELPFEGEGYLAYAHNVVAGRLRPPPRGSRVPNRLRRILLRGLSTEPDRRYPSMAALLADLDRAMSAPRRRIALAAAGLVGAGALAFALLGGGGQAPDPCAAADQPAAGLWDPSARRQVEAAFTSAGKPDAADAFARLDRAMSRRVGQIRAMHREACLAAEVRREESEVLFDRRLQCLASRRQEVAAFTAVYASGDRSVMERALQAALSLPPVEQCADRKALMAPVPPPADPAVRARVAELEPLLASAVALESAGKWAEAAKQAESVVAQADPIGYAPLRARAHFHLAKIVSSLDEHERCAAELRVAAELAAAARDDVLLARIWILLHGAVGYNMSKPDEARALEPVAAAAIERAGAGAELRAAFENSRGAVALGLADHPSAASHFLAAVRHYEEAFGQEHPKVAETLANAAVALADGGRFAEARQAHERALALKIKLLGPEHLSVGQTYKALGGLVDTMGGTEEALALFRRAQAIYEKSLPPDHQWQATVLSSIAVQLDKLDRPREALPLHLRGIAILERKPKGNEIALSFGLTNLGVCYEELERYRDALAVYRRAIALKEQVLGRDHPAIAYTLSPMGLVARRMGDLAQAASLSRRAVAILEKRLGRDHPEIARPLLSLAETALDARDPAEALALVERSKAIQEKAGQTDTPIYAQALIARGRALVALRRTPAAVPDLERGLALMKVKGASKKDLAEVEAILARAQKKRGR